MSGTPEVAAGGRRESGRGSGPGTWLEADPGLGAMRHEASEGRGLGALVALARGEEQAFPLRELRVRARIAGPLCVTEIEQRFANPLTRPLEALYLFPVPARATVTELGLRVGDRELKAECRERARAEQAFAAARQAGHRAGLLLRERRDLHALRVTNLPPGSEVTVRMVLLEELMLADGHWEWRFPTVIAPRFLPGTPWGQTGSGVLPDTDRVRRWHNQMIKNIADLGTLRNFTQLYRVYVRTEIIFDDTNLRALHAALPKAAQKDRGFDPTAIDWEDYMMNVHLPSITTLTKAFSARRAESKAAAAPRPQTELPTGSDIMAVFDLEGTVVDTNLVEQYLWVLLGLALLAVAALLLGTRLTHRRAA